MIGTVAWVVLVPRVSVVSCLLTAAGVILRSYAASSLVVASSS